MGIFRLSRIRSKILSHRFAGSLPSRHQRRSQEAPRTSHARTSMMKFESRAWPSRYSCNIKSRQIQRTFAQQSLCVIKSNVDKSISCIEDKPAGIGLVATPTELIHRWQIAEVVGGGKENVAFQERAGPLQSRTEFSDRLTWESSQKKWPYSQQGDIRGNRRTVSPDRS